MVSWKRIVLWGLTGLLVLAVGIFLRTGIEGNEPVRAADPPGTTLTTAAATTQPSSVSVDVVVYGTQTSGITAAHEIVSQNPRLRVAIVSSGGYLQSPLAQGLSVEDAREISRVSGGAYQEWRNDVISYYEHRGERPFTSGDRLVYEPAVAAGYLWALLEGPVGTPILFYPGKLLDAGDTGDNRYVKVRTNNGSDVVINTTYFIDASVEADLARMLGASYRIGRDETVYNDREGTTPQYPSAANQYVSAPQRLSVLLTLAPLPAGVPSSGDDTTSAQTAPTAGLGSVTVSTVPLSAQAVKAFGRSWSMVTAVLPSGTHELNERWSDFPDTGLAFDWVFDVSKRPAIMQRAVDRALGQISYLQQNGYPQIGVSHVPDYPYVREGPRVMGLTTYTSTDVLEDKVREVVATGCYTEYDRHDNFQPNQIDTTTFVRVPMHALMVAGHPWLLVSTAVSTDFQAYSSAIRTELTRANIGGAAGTLVVLAAAQHFDPTNVPYDEVRKQLELRGYRLF